MSEFDRLAVIEVGTKGIRLLVVQRRDPPHGMEILESRGALGNLGEGLDQNQGRMRRENIQLSLEHVQNYLRMAQAKNPDRIELVGTEVFRRATNVDEFRELLPKSLSLWILKPEEEAVGSFVAASWGLRDMRPGLGPLVVIDLGGGSLEVVGGLQSDPPRPIASVSMGAIGTLSLREAWMHGAKSPDAAQRLARYINAEIGRHADEFAAFRAPNGPEANGPGKLMVAGLGSTVTDSVWVLNSKSLNRYKSKDVNGLSASRHNLQQLRDELLRLTGLGQTPASALSHGIKDVLGHQLGLAALLAVMDALGARMITACGTGLRFGLAYTFLHDLPLTIPRACTPETADRVEPSATTIEPPVPVAVSNPVEPVPTPTAIESAPISEQIAADVLESAAHTASEAKGEPAALPEAEGPGAPTLKEKLEALSEKELKALAKAIKIKGHTRVGREEILKSLLTVDEHALRQHLQARARDYTRLKPAELLAECVRRRLAVEKRSKSKALIQALEEWDRLSDEADAPVVVQDAAAARTLLEERGRLPWPVINRVLRGLGRQLTGCAARGGTLGSGSLSELLEWGFESPMPSWEGHRPVETARIGPDFVVAPECLGMYGGRRGPATDVYVLGELAMALLAGRLPADAETRESWVEQAVPNLRLFLAFAPFGLSTLLRRAMASDPEERQLSTVASFLQALDQLRPIDAFAPSPPTAFEAAAESHHGIRCGPNRGLNDSENADGTFIQLGSDGRWGVLALADGVTHCTIGTPQAAKGAFLESVKEILPARYLPLIVDSTAAPGALWNLRSFLQTAANDRVIAVSQSALRTAPPNGSEIDPASVSALLGLLCRGTFYTASLGDCRAYLINPTLADRLTVDGTQGVLNLRDLSATGPALQDNRLALVLGNARYEPELGLTPIPPPEVFLTHCTVWPGDCLALASDGLYRAFRDEASFVERVRELVFRDRRPLPEAAFELMVEANRGYGKDNLSVILCRPVGDR